MVAIIFQNETQKKKKKTKTGIGQTGDEQEKEMTCFRVFCHSVIQQNLGGSGERLLSDKLFTSVPGDI